MKNHVSYRIQFSMNNKIKIITIYKYPSRPTKFFIFSFYYPRKAVKNLVNHCTCQTCRPLRSCCTQPCRSSCTRLRAPGTESRQSPWSQRTRQSRVATPSESCIARFVGHSRKKKSVFCWFFNSSFLPWLGRSASAILKPQIKTRFGALKIIWDTFRLPKVCFL